MNRSNKDGVWKVLFSLSVSDFIGRNGDGFPMVGEPAVQVTFSTFGNEIRFSHTPGIFDENCNFKPVQHLHDRYIWFYINLFQSCAIGTETARSLGMDHVFMLGGEFKVQFVQAILKEKGPRFFDDLLKIRSSLSKHTRSSVSHEKTRACKSSFGASIGDIVATKQKK